MKKAYSLDYSIERDIDRVRAVQVILDGLDTDPSPTDLEQMGSYILYGKDANGLNAVQRGETIDGNSRRFASFKKTDDKLLSLDEILDNPLADQQHLKSATQRYVYIKKKPGIRRPKGDDPGDSDIPGMTQLWESIDHLKHWINILEKKIPPDETTKIIEVDSYRLYQLKHQLIDLQRHQYYLRDSYKPTLHFQNMDRPKQQFIDWSSDSAYWMPLDQWQRKVATSLLSSVSKNLEDYETRVNPVSGETEVHWIVRRHTFDFENPAHIKAFINYMDLLQDFFHDKLDTYGRALLFDFERYREMAHLSDVRNFILDKKIQKLPYTEISLLLQQKTGLYYNENHLCTILAKEIPDKIAVAAQKHRLIVDTPASQCKKCCTCGRLLPKDPLFFVKNRSRKDGLSSNCKECEKRKRIEKGGQSVYDRRNKETSLS